MGDHRDVDCTVWVEAISAMADDEEPGIDPRMVAAHVKGCEACAALRGSVERPDLHRSIEVAPVMPDLGRSVARSAAAADRGAQPRWLRWFLVLIAVQIAVLSAPALLFGEESGSSSHGARHLGAFTMAYAVGLLVVAMRPARARTVLPVALVLVGALLLSAVVDLVEGSIALTDELLHLPEVLSLGALWLLLRPDLLAALRRSREPSRRPRRPSSAGA